jgi:hypothetical protein
MVKQRQNLKATSLQPHRAAAFLKDTKISLYSQKNLKQNGGYLHRWGGYALVENIVAGIRVKNPTHGDKWLSADEAMALLRLRSKTTLQKLRTKAKYGLPNWQYARFFMTAIPLSITTKILRMKRSTLNKH